MSYEYLLERVGTQKHLLHFWNELSDDDKRSLAKQIESINFDSVKKAFDASANVYTASPDNLTPVPDNHHLVFKNLSEEEKSYYWRKGLEAISRGEIAAIVLAGGQASRLGSSAPKGTLPLGLGVSPCDSLLSIQACKIALLEKLAIEEFPEAKETAKIQWLVMASRSTENATRNHLGEVIPAAGLSFDQVTMFTQAEIPAFDNDGNLLLADKHTVVTAPNGNGGLYSALAVHLPEMKMRGVKYFHVYCIDNILCKVADPHWLGYCIEKHADVSTKVCVCYKFFAAL
ncbi:UDP-N-acetylhexosamine pyrophosphorylase isoform b [Trichostrongylus colubriformis]|uniref:UDP-N-acetylglucosamine diphosphorylase n=1 Tax=Trichostrongylus colubriformis TaxID=6319 RepID=A0AAN8F0N2_TRICO